MVAALALLAVLNLFLTSRTWFFLLVSFGLLLLASYLWVLSLARGLRVGRIYRQSLIQVGDRLTESFRVVNRSLLPVPWLELRDDSDLPGYSVSRTIALGGQSDLSWQAGGLCLQRGQFRLGPWRVRTGDPFGLFEVTASADRSVELLVYPPVGRVPGAEPEKGRSAGDRRQLRAASEQTVTTAGVRQYRPGDPLRHVHWPTTLRLGDLMVKDFDLDPAGDLWIIMDMEAASQAGHALDSTEEAAVMAAAAVAGRVLSQGNAVGLLAYGERRVLEAPARGEMQHWRLMQSLATIRALGQWPLVRMVEGERTSLAGGAGVVVIAASDCATLPTAVDLLRRAGARPAVLLLDSASFGGRADAHTQSETLTRLAVRHWVLGSDYQFVDLDRRQRRRRAAARRAGRWGLEGTALRPVADGSGAGGPDDRA